MRLRNVPNPACMCLSAKHEANVLRATRQSQHPTVWARLAARNIEHFEKKILKSPAFAGAFFPRELMQLPDRNANAREPRNLHRLCGWTCQILGKRRRTMRAAVRGQTDCKLPSRCSQEIQYSGLASGCDGYEQHGRPHPHQWYRGFPRPDGNPVLCQVSMEYLGRALSASGDITTELNRWLGTAVERVWKHSTLEWGMTLLYTARLRRLGALQAGCQRKILGIYLMTPQIWAHAVGHMLSCKDVC